MSFGGYDDSSAWGPGADVGEDLVRDALRKDALLKWVYALAGPSRLSPSVLREIAAAQEDLKGPYIMFTV
jgi:hypothetical protein